MISKEELEESAKFQDYVSDLLYDIGIPINLYTSFKYQIEKGESRAGVEIKYDKQLEKTGNIYIEIAERHSINEPFVASGIMRKDNTIFYAIGNYEHVRLFSKKQLQILARSKEFKRVQTDTSMGVLMPIEYVEKHSGIVIVEWINGKRYEKKEQQTSKVRTK